MGMFLNSRMPYGAYKDISEMRFFVDKTLLLKEMIESVEIDRQQYLCITRPRRFGKSVMANMIGAFFGNAVDAKDVFDHLAIASKDINKGKKYYTTHINIIALMVSGEHIEVKLEGYSATSTELNSKNQIYSAMVVYGLLTYEEEVNEAFIPNRELMDKYKELLMSN